MTLGVAWIHFDRLACIGFGGLEVRVALLVIPLVGAQIDGRSRRLPQRLVVPGVGLQRRLVMLQGSRSVHGDIFFVAEGDVVGCSLCARDRRNHQHSRKGVLQGAHV